MPAQSVALDRLRTRRRDCGRGRAASADAVRRAALEFLLGHERDYSLDRSRHWFRARFFRAERVTDKVIADLPHGSGEFAAFGQDVVERIHETIDFAFADRERRQN